MPIAVDIAARIDKRSFESVAKDATKTAEQAGEAFVKTFGDAVGSGFGKANGPLQKPLKETIKESERAGISAAESFNKAYAAALGKSAGSKKSWEDVAKQSRDIYEKSGKEAGDAFTKAAYAAMGSKQARGETADPIVKKSRETYERAGREAGNAFKREAAKAGDVAGKAFNDALYSTMGKQAGARNSIDQIARQSRDVYARAGKDAGDAFSRAAYSAMGQRSAPGVGGGGGGGFMGGAFSESNGIIGQFRGVGGGAGKAFVAGAAAVILGTMFMDMGRKAGSLVAQGFTSVLDEGLAFSRALNEIQGATQATGPQMAEIRSEAQALGSDLNLVGATAGVAAEAMTELVKGGLNVEQAMAAARGTIQLATAAQISAAEAAEIQAKALVTFRIPAQEASRVADVLAATAQAVPGSMAETAEAIKNVGATSSAFGYSLEETVAILGTFIQGGLDGAEAGNALNTMITTLVNPTGESAKAIETLGLKLRDASGNLLPMRDLILQLKEAQDGLNPAVFQQASSQLFGTRGIRGAAIAGTQGVEIFDRMMQSFVKGGQAGEVAASQVRGLPGVLERVSNTADQVKLSFFDMAESFLQAGGDAGVAKFDELADWINMNRPQIVQFFGDVGQAAIFMAQVVAMQVGITAKAFQLFIEQIAVVAGGLGSAMQALAAPLQNVPDKVLGALSPAALALKQFGTEGGQSLKDFSEGAKRNADALGGMGDAAGVLAKETLPGIAGSLSEMTDKAVAAEEQNHAYRESFNSLKDAIQLVPEDRTVILKENTEEVRKKLEALGITLKEMPDGTMRVNVEYRDAQSGMLIPLDGQSKRKGAKPSTKGDQAIPGADRGELLPYQAPPGSTKEEIPYFDPSLWQVGGGATPGSPVLGGPGIGAPGIPGGAPGLGTPDGVKGSEYLRAQNNVLDQQEALSEAKLRLLEVEADSTATQRDLLTAQNNVAQAERSLAESRAALAEKAMGTAEDLQNANNEIGVALDADLGLSRGFAGLADNFVRFIGSLATAPLQAELNLRKGLAMKEAGLSESGSGLIGAFAPPVPAESEGGYLGNNGANASTTAVPTNATLGTPAVQGASGNTAAMMAFAASLSGNVKYGPASDMANGLADCSGSISDLVEILQTGQATPARLFTTTNFASDAEAAKIGALPGHKPGALNVGVNPYPGMSGHMAATMPDGTHFEGGGGTGGGAQLGGNAAGADDPQFEKWYHFPTGLDGGIASMPNLGATTPGVSASAGASGGTSGLPVPLPVIIVGGGVAAPGASGAPASTPGVGSVPGNPGATGAPGTPSAPRIGGPPPTVSVPPAVGSPPPVRDPLTEAGLYPPIASPGGVPVGPSSSPVIGGPGIPGPGSGSTGTPLPPSLPMPQRDPATGLPVGDTPGATGGLGTPNLTMPGGPSSNTSTGLTPGGAGGVGGIPLPGQLGGPPAGLPGGLGDPGAGAPGSARTELGAQGRERGKDVWQAKGGGFQGLGGLPMAAIQGAIQAGGMAGGGFGGQAGAAAMQMATQLINRTIGFGGQAAGIGIEGLGETLLPSGSQLGDMSQNMLFRIAGGFAGAAPQLANLAGSQDGGEKPGEKKGNIAEEIQKGFAQVGKQGGGNADQSQPLVGTMNVGSPQDGNAMNKELSRTQNLANSYGAGAPR